MVKSLMLVCFLFSSINLYAYIDPGNIGLPLQTGAPILIWLLSLLSAALLFFRQFIGRLFPQTPKKWKTLLLVLALILAITAIYICYKMKNPTTSKKMFVLGIDALDPKIVKMLFDKGELPNFKKLAASGTFCPLATSTPPQSPVAWTTLATGNTPDKHGLFDFIKRDPKTYMPSLSAPEWQNGKPVKARKSPAFWEVTSKNKIKTTILHYPLTFPPEEVKGCMLSGMGVPDLRGTPGNYSFYTTDASFKPEDPSGTIIYLDKTPNGMETYILGPRNTLSKDSKDIKLPLLIGISGDTINLKYSDKTVKLNSGRWSPWIELQFPLTPFNKIKGICRFYLLQSEPRLKLYMTPIQFHPEKPAFPISYPDSYAKKLSKEIGLYYTAGMAEDTNALGDGIIPENVFLEMCDQIFEERKAKLFHELKKFKEGLLVVEFDTLDRIQHMFWRYIDDKHPLYNKFEPRKYRNAIYDYYKKMDVLLGEALQELGDETVLIVISDHGFAPFRYEVNLNTWLYKNGYLAFIPAFNPDKDSDEFFQNVDWQRTKAYSLGLGGAIYINLKGREANGIVNPGDEYGKLVNKIGKSLEKLEGLSGSGSHIITKITNYNLTQTDNPNSEIPDIIAGFKPGYRISKLNALGGYCPEMIKLHAKKWSGDHCCTDPDFIPGSFFTNVKTPVKELKNYDIAPTIQKFFNCKIPEGIKGAALPLSKD